MESAMPTMSNHRSLFRQLLAGMYDAVIITDPNGHLIEQNARAAEFFGYATEEVMDRPIGVFIPGATPAVVQRIREGLADARHVMLDANCLTKAGTAFAAEVSVSIIDLMDPGDLVFTIRNVERRRRRIEAYRSKENCFKISQAGLFACAPDGHFRWVNPAFAEMFALETDDDEASGHCFAEILDDEPLAELFAKALAGESSVMRLRAEGEGGQAETVEVALAPDLHGKKIRGVVGSVFRVQEAVS